MKLTSTKHYNYIHDSFQGLFLFNLPIKAMTGSVVAFACYLTGSEAQILEVIGILLIADFLMGILVAIKHKTFSSDYIVDILYRAAMYFVLLMGVNWTITICPYLWLLRDITHLLIASAELVSILENAGLLGFKDAQKVINIINRNVEDKLKKQ